MNKIWLICILFCAVVLSGCGDKSKIIYSETVESTELDCEPEGMVPVYVCGAVVNPGVYYLDSGALVKDALDAAGGFAEGAADGYINLADTLEANERIYFPYADEVEASILQAEECGTNGDESAGGRVNINTATVEQLMDLDGIGEGKARAIIEYREEHGGFSDISEIMNIPGIKEGVYNKIKEKITT